MLLKALFSGIKNDLCLKPPMRYFRHGIPDNLHLKALTCISPEPLFLILIQKLRFAFGQISVFQAAFRIWNFSRITVLGGSELLLAPYSQRLAFQASESV